MKKCKAKQQYMKICGTPKTIYSLEFVINEIEKDECDTTVMDTYSQGEIKYFNSKKQAKAFVRKLKELI